MSKPVAVVNTGTANLASVLAGIARAGGSPTLTTEAKIVEDAEYVVLPGVGTFGDSMEGLVKANLVEVVKNRINANRPTFLVCVGLQLLGLSSDESPGVQGLGVVPSHVTKFLDTVRVPQHGWNHITAETGCTYLTDGQAYYTNSYRMPTVPVGWKGATSLHGDPFVGAIERGAILACQFHPELSGKFGLNLMKAWLDKSAAAALPSVSKTNLMRRIIPCLDIKNGRVVKGIKFQNLRDAGDPAQQAETYEATGADELVFLDVSATDEGRKACLDTIQKVRAVLSIPMCVGGGVKSVADAHALLTSGADKVAINTAAVRKPELITEIASKFGSQCTVLAVDCARRLPAADGTEVAGWEVVISAGKERTGLDVLSWVRAGVERGAGEILLTSWDRDGTHSGYDLDLTAQVSAAVSVPVIASGGASSPAHLAEALLAGADAVLAASIFHDGVYSIEQVKKELTHMGVLVRPHENQAAVRAFAAQNLQPIVPLLTIAGGVPVLPSGTAWPSSLAAAQTDALSAARELSRVGQITVRDGEGGRNEHILREIVKETHCRVHLGDCDVDTAISWLDGAAQTVIVSGTQCTAENLSQIPTARVVLELTVHDDPSVSLKESQTSSGSTLTAAISDVKGCVGGLLFLKRSGLLFSASEVEELQSLCGPDVLLTVDGGPTVCAASVANWDRLGVETQVDLRALTLDLSELFAAPLISDRLDGLFSTVVVDEAGKALGFCYSSTESIQQSLATGTGVYQSRKRGLWYKGASSGATQELIKIGMDCDRDTLIVQVRQKGAGFCHVNNWTCFGPDSGLAQLSRKLLAYHDDPNPKSYTRRLWGDKQLLLSKLVEESHELAEAESAAEVAAEAADLLYFALATMARSNVPLADVERVLDARHLKVTRRPGNAKPAGHKHSLETPAPTPTPTNTTSTPSPATSAATHQPPATTEAGPFRFKRVSASDLGQLNRDPVDDSAREAAAAILKSVREKGEAGVLEHAVRLGDIPSASDGYIRSVAELKQAYDNLSEEDRTTLTRTAERIRRFAELQKASLTECSMPIVGGEAGQSVAPVERAGCYAPGGRYPLPSSVLMTVVTARVAGCASVVVASPRPAPMTLAAAYVAGADCLLAIGGAQAIAAMAYGAGPVKPVDVVCGPGNRWVTAAKSLVAGTCGIDMLAGPSECLCLCDDTANPEIVAADLIAQAEHDVAAGALLVTTDATLIEKVEAEITEQLRTLPTRDTAAAALANQGFAVLVSSLEEAIPACDRLAPEHLEVHARDSAALSAKLNNYGGLFIGEGAAEVFGDYGAGPNHTLPTGGCGRFTGGLSVHTFLRTRTWLRIDDHVASQELVEDASRLALTEGLHGHSRAALKRKTATNAQTTTAPPSPITMCRPELLSLKYVPVKPLDALAREVGVAMEALVKIDANENVYGVPEPVSEALAQALGASSELHIYPDPQQLNLRCLIAEDHEVTPEQVVVGAGADDLLDIILRAVQCSAVMVCPPTFGMYAFLGRLAAKKIYEVPRLPNFDVDVEAVITGLQRDSGCRLLFLPSPNNPTGNPLSTAEVARLCTVCPSVLVVLDEAYIDFATTTESAVPLIAKFPNLVILRTFSKWAGLAGLRAGYSVSHKDLAGLMLGTKQPYNLNVMADVAAQAAMRNRKLIMNTSVAAIKAERSVLMEQLKCVPWLQPLPTEANFILCRVVDRVAADVALALRKKGIFVRFFGKQGGDLSQYIRVSVGRPQDTVKLVMALLSIDAPDAQPFRTLRSVYDCQAILFDMDGVLADVSQSYRKAIEATASFFGAAITGEHISAAKNQGNANDDWELTHRLIVASGMVIPPPDLPTVTSKFQEYYLGTADRRGLRETERLLVPQPLLTALAAKYPLAVVTGRPKDEAHHFLDTQGIASLFSTVVTREDAALKPSPEPVLLALRRLSVTRAVMVGDTPDDLRAAHRANVVAIGVPAPGDAQAQPLWDTGAVCVAEVGCAALAALVDI